MLPRYGQRGRRPRACPQRVVPGLLRRFRDQLRGDDHVVRHAVCEDCWIDITKGSSCVVTKSSCYACHRGDFFFAEREFVNFTNSCDDGIDDVEFGEGPWTVTYKMTRLRLVIRCSASDTVESIVDEIVDIMGPGLLKRTPMVFSGKLFAMHMDDTL